MNKKKHFYSIFIRLWFAAKMAFDGIIANPLRSALTILGVVIGVTSVVSLMGIGEGARRAVIEQFESLGTNVIQIKAHHASVEFEPDYVKELVERVDDLKIATPVIYTKSVMKWRRTRGNVEIIGVNNLFPEIRDHGLVAGHFFTSLHVKQRASVAVLGYNIGLSLLGGRNVVGQSVTLNGQTFTIIGVLSQKGEGNAEDIDNKIVIPYTSAQKIAEKRTVEEIWGKAETMNQTDLAVVQLSRILKSKLGIGQNAPEGYTENVQEEKAVAVQEGMVTSTRMMGEPKESKAFVPSMGEDLITITNLNQLVKEADNANRVMTLLLGGIAAVSLLVGGLGIMNIMMVAVSERTEEIGVRRALGGKQTDLLLQFILEALYVSLIGSLIGIIVGIWGLNFFESIGFKTAISFQAIKIATVVALASGLLFGVYPAVSASSLPPVEALRRQ
jgi:putative ABC transport system permease protein